MIIMLINTHILMLCMCCAYLCIHVYTLCSLYVRSSAMSEMEGSALARILTQSNSCMFAWASNMHCAAHVPWNHWSHRLINWSRVLFGSSPVLPPSCRQWLRLTSYAGDVVASKPVMWRSRTPPSLTSERPSGMPVPTLWCVCVMCRRI